MIQYLLYLAEFALTFIFPIYFALNLMNKNQTEKYQELLLVFVLLQMMGWVVFPSLDFMADLMDLTFYLFKAIKLALLAGLFVNDYSAVALQKFKQFECDKIQCCLKSKMQKMAGCCQAKDKEE